MDCKRAVIRASDAASWSLCLRRAWLDHNQPLGNAEREDPFADLIIELGLLHERKLLKDLQTWHQVERAISVEHTTDLMDRGVEVIYQGQLTDSTEGIVGYPDFLLRTPSGDYQAADGKLALKSDKKEIQVQLALYRKLLNNPLPAIAFLGGGNEELIDESADKILAKFLREMRTALSSSKEPDVRFSHSKCVACPYYTHCKPQFEAKEDLSLLYGVDGRATSGLETNGIATISQLATADAASIPDVPYLKGHEKKHRAVLQAQSYLTGKIFQLSEIYLPDGDWLHFDIEDNPLTSSGEKHVYLWGFLVPDYNNDNFEYVWTDHEDDDREGWIGFLTLIEQYRKRYPNLILAHYSQHERSTIRMYAKRYSMEDNATMEYLLGDNSPLFDMQKPVKNNLVLPLQGYGLKDICKHEDLVDFQWEDDNAGSQWSVVQFNKYLSSSNEKEELKQAILGYNRDDVIATHRLEQWLRAFKN